MSMVVSFTITPWLAYYLLKRRSAAAHDSNGQHEHDDVKQTLIYRAFRPLMETLLKRRWVAWSFMAVVVPLMALTAATATTTQ